jgi:hypothetical protein
MTIVHGPTSATTTATTSEVTTDNDLKALSAGPARSITRPPRHTTSEDLTGAERVPSCKRLWPPTVVGERPGQVLCVARDSNPEPADYESSGVRLQG